MDTMVEAKQVTTADELLGMQGDGYRYELVRGELRRMSPVGSRHGWLTARLTARLIDFVEQRGLGTVMTADTGFRIAAEPDTVRAPDVAFVAPPRAAEARSEPGFVRGAPELAIEVVSPSDRYSAVHEKVLDWLDAGTAMVLVVDPERRTVTVYRSRDDVRVLRGDDAIAGGDVVPGWSLPLAELFAAGGD